MVWAKLKSDPSPREWEINNYRITYSLFTDRQLHSSVSLKFMGIDFIDVYGNNEACLPASFRGRLRIPTAWRGLGSGHRPACRFPFKTLEIGGTE